MKRPTSGASHPKYAGERFDFDECWRELIAAAQPDTALLVSSEDLSAVPPTQLREATAGDGFEKRIILYLRRQDRAIEAYYQQDVRLARFSGSIDEYVDEIVDRNPALGRFQYRELVSGLRAEFGRDRVQVLHYEEDREREWRFASALKALGLSLDPSYELTPPRNRSLHPLFLE